MILNIKFNFKVKCKANNLEISLCNNKSLINKRIIYFSILFTTILSMIRIKQEEKEQKLLTLLRKKDLKIL